MQEHLGNRSSEVQGQSVHPPFIFSQIPHFPWVLPHPEGLGLCSQQPPYQARVDTILAPLVSME